MRKRLRTKSTSELSDSYSLEREPTISFGRLLDLIALGCREPDHLSSLASRLARLSRKISHHQPGVGHRPYEQTIDTVSKDMVLEAGFTEDAAQDAVQSFLEVIEESLDEITALQALYERPYRQRLRLMTSASWPTPCRRRPGRGLPNGCGRHTNVSTSLACAAPASAR